MKNNPYIDLSFQELELAYELFTYNEQWEAVRLVADAFCLKAELDIIPLNWLKYNTIWTAKNIDYHTAIAVV